jgi:hypothetical protein
MKLGIIGTGNVGNAIALAAVTRGSAREIVRSGSNCLALSFWFWQRCLARSISVRRFGIMKRATGSPQRVSPPAELTVLAGALPNTAIDSYF